MIWLENLGRRVAETLFSPMVGILAAKGVTPNQITWAGLLGYGVIAGLLVANLPRTAGVALAILGPLDAIDGMLARKNGQVTSKGAFLDSTLDRYAEVLLFLGLIFHLLKAPDDRFLNAFLILAALSGSLLVSYTRARAEALGFSCKIGLMTRFERLLIISIALILDVMQPALIFLAILTHLTAFQRIRYVMKQGAGA